MKQTSESRLNLEPVIAAAAVSLTALLRYLIAPFAKGANTGMLFILPALYLSKRHGWQPGLFALVLGIFFEGLALAMGETPPRSDDSHNLLDFILYLTIGTAAVYLARKNNAQGQANGAANVRLNPRSGLATGSQPANEIWIEAESDSTGTTPAQNSHQSTLSKLFTSSTSRKSDASILRFQNTLLRCQLEASPDGILVVGVDARVLSCNRRFLDLLEISEQEVLTCDCSILELVGSKANDPLAFAESVDAISADALARSHDEMLLANGKTLDRHCGPIRATDGSLLGRVWFFRDITTQKLTTLSLLASETRLRLILESVPAPIAILDRDLCYLYASRRWLNDYRLGKRNIIGQGHYEVFPDVSEEWKEIHKECLAGAVRKSDDDRFERQDGTVQWIRWEVRPWFHPTGEVGGLMMFSEDITERKLAEKALQERERLLGIVTGCAGVGLVVVNNRYEFLFSNEAYAGIFGLKPEDLIGRLVPDVRADEWKRIQPRLDRALAGERIAYELTLHAKEEFSKRRFFRVIFEPGSSDSESITVAVVVMEITELKRTEMEKRRSADLLDAVVKGTTDSVFVKDRAGKYLLINAAAARFMGKPVEEILGKDDSEFFDAESARQVMQRDRKAMAGGLVDTGEEKLTADGKTRVFLSTKGPFLDDNGEVAGVIGISRDITDRKWAEKKLLTQNAVVTILAQAADLRDASGKLLRAICENMGFEAGDLWLVDVNANALYFVDMWHRDEPGMAPFLEASRTWQFGPNEELPGRVWEEGKSIWIADVTKSQRFPPVKEGRSAAIRGALGFPIRLGREFIGVGEFFSTDHQPPGPELLQIFDGLASQIGQFIERKRAESGLRLFRALIDQTSDGIEVLDPETGRFLDANEKTCIAHGYTREEYLNLSAADVDPLVAANSWEKMLSGGYLNGPGTVESIHRRKDGSTFPVEINFNTILLDRDYMVAVVRDITERKRVEETLRQFNQELEERVKSRTAELATRTREFETVVRSIPDTVIRLKSDRTVVFFQSASHDEIPGIQGCSGSSCNRADCLLCQTIAEAMKVARESCLEGGTGISEMEIPAGVLELRLTALADGELLVLARDISARRKLEKEIMNALKYEKNLSEMKSQFISVASHEFRTPITAVAGSVDLLLNFSDRLIPAKRLELLNRIAAGADRMKSIVEDVLVLSRADAGKLEVSPSQSDLSELFQDIVQEAEVGDKNAHRFALDFHGENRPVHTDVKLLRPIISNLLSNAIRYSPEGSLIYVGIHREQTRFYFEVKDEGIGIPLKDRPNLFEPFYRASNVGQISGTGLGLSIVKRYTELLGGKIHLVPTERGACFHVSIPDESFVAVPSMNGGVAEASAH